MFFLKTNSHQMDEYLSPTIDGMALKYIKDMTQLYAQKIYIYYITYITFNRIN